MNTVRYARLLLFSTLLAFVATASADSGKIGLIYPQTAPPYSAVFEAIRDAAVRSGGEAAFDLLRLPGNDHTRDGTIRHWFSRVRPSVVITLGRVASEAYRDGGFSAPQVIGALRTSPQSRPAATGITLSTSPGPLFAQLKRLNPQIQRIWVVYEPARDAWLIERAKADAQDLGLTLLAREASDLRTGAQQFRAILTQADGATDALWLVGNLNLLSTEDTLPWIVEESWRRYVTVFSDTLVHAERGATFASYLDPEALGRRLGELAHDLAAGGTKHPIEALSDLKFALNTRMARRLGLSPRAERYFDLLFPKW